MIKLIRFFSIESRIFYKMKTISQGPTTQSRRNLNDQPVKKLCAFSCDSRLSN